MFTVRNTVIVAIMQVGVIVAGVLASGLCHKMFGEIMLPWQTTFLYSYGITGFSIPMVWATIALIIERRSDVSDDVKDLTFWLGIFTLILLAIFVIFADASPLLSVSGGLADD